MQFTKGKLLYDNPLASAEHIRDFRLEGDACITFPRARTRMENAYERHEEEALHANFVLWCDHDFPDSIAVSWDFQPLTDAGLAMFWLAAKGRNGEDLFDHCLKPRNGDYQQYHHGDIDALHASYYRRNPGEISFRTCNLRKSYGFHLVCQSGDPLPDARYALRPYRIEVVKCGPHVRFSMNDVVLFHWVDDQKTCGSVLTGGKIGFRQMAGLIADYANLRVHAVELTSHSS